MFPIRDHNPSKSFPIVTILIIIVTAFAFYLQLTAPDFEGFIMQYALVPNTVDLSRLETLLPFIYSIFMHGGWLHIISNMWFLWIFGDNVEAALGHIPYAMFYLLCGITAGVTQFLFSQGSEIPMLGASGAVAGVLGAYLVLFPRHKVDTLMIMFGGFMQRIQVPASFMLGYWFLIQVLSGVGSFGGQEGGVAWWAHIGGFAAGWILVRLLTTNNTHSHSL